MDPYHEAMTSLKKQLIAGQITLAQYVAARSKLIEMVKELQHAR